MAADVPLNTGGGGGGGSRRPGELERRMGSIDLARFAVETLKRIDADSDPKYFFADAKRPGSVAGPYSDTQAFIDDYQRYRSRTIVAFRELPSYQKQRRERALRSAVTLNK